MLRPWLLPKTAPLFTAVLDAVQAVAVEAEGKARWALGAYGLVSRLDETLGAEIPLHALNAPGRLLATIGTDRVDFDVARSLDARAWCALPLLCEARGLDEDTVWTALWRAWNESGGAASMLLDASLPIASRVWRAAPVEILTHAVVDGWILPNDAPYSMFSDEQCLALLDAIIAAGISSEFLWSEAPESFVERALASGRVDEVGARVLWYRTPAALLAAMDRDLGSDSRWTCTVLDNMPPPHTAHAVGHLRRLSANGSLDVEWATSWLYARIRDRSPGWRDAYALLAEIVERAGRMPAQL